MPRQGSSPLAWLRAALRTTRAGSGSAHDLARRLSPLLASAWPSALALGRQITVRTAPPRLVYGWLAGAWVAQSMAVVARLEIADRLKAGPRSCDELAAETGTHAPSLYRVMRALASIGLFSEDEQGRFTTTRLGRTLERDAPDSIHPLALMVGSDWHWQSWGRLLDTVQTGEPAFVSQYGTEAYAYFAQHPADGAVFDAHIEAYSRQAARSVTSYDFGRLQTVVDVGGGYGAVLAAILRSNPKLRGVLFDQPAVIDGARSRVADAGLAGRCELVSGSFFDGVPEGGDVYVLSSILHNWDDARAVEILRACRRAMRPSARLLIVELVIPPGNTPADGKLLDLQMMVLFAGGRERTPDEYRALLAAGGFRVTRVIPTPSQMSLIEATCR
ncbi:MAG TPA: methyltransferase [Chloroflexota bacterium]|nr:methyltransferase [Chloroflexota bacterium]